MLIKLIKHEITATRRIFLPLYGALLVLTIFTKLVLNIGAPDFFTDNISTPAVIEVILSISFMLYLIAIIALSIMTLVMIIQRFYKNLFTDEGYLMFSLPVKTWELVLSKLLVGLMWTLVCTVIIFVTFFIFSLGAFSMMDLTQTIQTAYTDFYATFGTSLNLLIFELILSSIVGVIASILMIYVSIAIGQLFSQHRIVASFGAYIGITIALQIIGSIIMAIFMMVNINQVINQNQEVMEFFQWFLNATTLFNVVLSIGFYFTTQYIMKNHLNLE